MSLVVLHLRSNLRRFDFSFHISPEYHGAAGLSVTMHFFSGACCSKISDSSLLYRSTSSEVLIKSLIVIKGDLAISLQNAVLSMDRSFR